MIEILVVFLVAVIAGLTGWFLRGSPKPEGAVPISPLPTPLSRCRTITYYYDDGFAKTYHSCQGHQEFTDRCGRRLAPKGAKLVRAVGGVHV